MKSRFSAAVLLCVLAPLSAVQAHGAQVLLDAGDLSQIARVSIVGNENKISVVQVGLADGAANALTVSIEGDRNGGPNGLKFTGKPADLGLQPGRLVQSGFGNTMNVTVGGERNLFAMSQQGSHNTMHGSISGSANQAAVTQVGVGNFASFSQAGIGNSVSIQQTSW